MTIPQHISIIMDGNGRWAKNRGLERINGHVEGVKRVRDIVEKSVELGVKYLSLYTFSEENWNRPSDEVNALMKIMVETIAKEWNLFQENGVRFLALGNRARLSPLVNEAISGLEKATEKFDRMTLIIMISYSGRWDILQAVQKLSGMAPEDITPEVFESKLVTSGIPDPEIVIRTSGEKRISNYMLWQTSYSEFIFTDTLWPDFGKDSLVAALEEFSQRDRRFGKVK